MMEYSIVAFNGSNNCNRDTPQTFYDSYVCRKQNLISSRLCAAKKGNPINKEKFEKDIAYLSEAKENKAAVLFFIATLLGEVLKINSSLIKQAENLLKEGTKVPYNTDTS